MLSNLLALFHQARLRYTMRIFRVYLCTLVSVALHSHTDVHNCYRYQLV